ncbi:MAG TPA: superoxide dismutase family protein [Rhizomicrobium sp.]|nr:superoxide dismutase family protein [Rhizomicrobium sp.]
MRLVLAVFFLAALSATQALAASSGSARLVGLDGKPVGTAKFTQAGHGVLIELEAHGLKPGAHAVHIHSVGQCDAKGKFDSAGGHFSPLPKNHGFMDKHGAHAGDMTNQFADANGNLRASIYNPNVTLKRGERSLFDKDGSSIVIHAAADDYKSQPAGNAGGRVACGVITRM